MPLGDGGDQRPHRRQRAVIQARLDALHRGAAQHLGRPNDLHHRQPRRTSLQRRHRRVNARRNDPAQILLVPRDGAQRGRGAEIHDQQVPSRIPRHRADGVGDLVGAHLQRIAVADLQTRPRSRLQQERLEAEVLAEAVAQRVDHVGHHRADRGHRDRARVHAVFAQHRAEEGSVFIRGGADVGGPAEGGSQIAAFEHSAEDLGIADIETEQHRDLSCGADPQVRAGRPRPALRS